MTSPLDEAIRIAVDYVTNRAQHFFSVVRSKQEDGVLWFAFAYKEEAVQNAIRSQRFLSADDASKSGIFTVKKTAFLPISAIVTTDSRPLLDMINRCDKRQQFVAWFTLETLVPTFSANESSASKPSGTPQVSKVIIVDTLYQPSTINNSNNSQQQQQRSAPAARASTPGRAGISKDNSMIEDLKRDMQVTASQLQNQQRESAATPSRTLDGRPFLHSSSSSLAPRSSSQFNAPDNDDRNSVSPTRVRHPSNATSVRGEGPGGRNVHFFNSSSSASFLKQNQNQSQVQDLFANSGANTNNNNSNNSMIDANYSHLLKVSLQISDSVAKLSSKLDDLSSQYFNFEKAVSAQLVEMKNKVVKLESNVSEIRPKIQEVTESTLHFGTKLAHLRQETHALFEGVSRRVQSVSDSVIASNLRMTNSSSSNNFAPSPSLAVAHQQHQQNSNNYYDSDNTIIHNNNNNTNTRSSSSSAALQAVEDADRIVNFDDLVAKHSLSGGGATGAGGQRKGKGQQQQSTSSPSQNALDSFINENYDRKPNFASRKSEIDHREHAMSHAQEVVDEFQSVARDVINYEIENQDQHHPISLTGIHRQKASLELARQHAADRSEAQAIASNYMNERNKVLTGADSSSTRNANNGSSAGVAVPMENAGGSTGGASFVISDDATMFSYPGTSSNRATMNTRSSESLADMIASMEKRLQL